MDTFIWTRNFDTGLPKVDRQHHHLVDLINALGRQLSGNEVDSRGLQSMYEELIEYALTHFSDEEQLMSNAGLDPRHVESHMQSHRRFVSDVQLLKQSGATETIEMGARLLDYLAHWLSFHILGQDKDMAKQIEAIRAGSDPDAAYAAGEREQDAAVEPLLLALNGLIKQLSDHNRLLEERVTERTRELADANERLEKLSLTDQLTGLSNRRHAMLQLGSVWKEAVTHNSPLAVLMIDADNFKEVNDQHGHDAGDRVLIELSRTLSESLRTDDAVFRLGGDEFIALCPNTNLEDAMTVASTLLKRVAEMRVPTGDSFWNSSISIGVAHRGPRMKTFRELIKAADDSVYQAKEAGRNCARAIQSN